jgi:hypothetical protein
MNYKPNGTQNTVTLEPMIIKPDKVQIYTANGRGGGYIPNGGGIGGTINGSGWGAEAQRPKGTGGPGTIHNIATPSLMSELMGEQNDSQSRIDEQYSSRFSTLVADVERELEAKTVAAKTGLILTNAQSAAVTHQVLLECINEKHVQYIALKPITYGMKGHSPFFLMSVVPQEMVAEFLNDRTAPLETLGDLWELFDKAYSAALETKALALSEKLMTQKLAATAIQRDLVESASVASVDANLLEQDRRLAGLYQERDIYVRQLPEFLQQELLTEAGPMDGLSASQALERYRATLDQMGAAKLQEVKPIQAPPPFSSGGLTLRFPPENPDIVSPLSKPELEALNDLVYLQLNTNLGTKWVTYHDALLKKESARYLEELSGNFANLSERASNIEQLKDAVKFTLDFYAETTSKFGEKASDLARRLSQAARGKTIRNAEEAIRAYDNYKDVMGKKFNAQDRQAIANALAALDNEMMAKNLSKFGKALGGASVIFDASDLMSEATKSITTNDWRPFFIKVETILVSHMAGVLIAVMFGFAASTPIGILGFALIMAITSAMIDDELVTDINEFILNI